MLNSFCWGDSSPNSRGLHWLSWEKLFTLKVFCCIGFKSFKAFNMAMVGKQAWKLVSNPDYLIMWLLKAKYFPWGNYYGAAIVHNSIYVLHNIYSVKDVIWRGFQCNICIGESIRVWDHLWLHNADCILSTIDQHLIIIDSLNMEQWGAHQWIIL